MALAVEAPGDAEARVAFLADGGGLRRPIERVQGIPGTILLDDRVECRERTFGRIDRRFEAGRAADESIGLGDLDGGSISPAGRYPDGGSESDDEGNDEAADDASHRLQS